MFYKMSNIYNDNDNDNSNYNKIIPSFSNYDISSFPKITVSITGTINTESDFEEFKQGWLNCYIECDNKPFTFIFDTTNMGMVSALYAYKMSYFIKEIKALNNKLLEKSIIVVNNKYIHGLLHMIFLIEKPIAPVYIIDDLNYADILYERLGFGSCFYDSTKATLIEP